MKKINTDHLKELAETMDLIAQHQLDKASQIYYCVVKSVGDNECTIVFNNKQYTVPYYGGKPTPNKTYAIFLPHNNMNESFVIGDGKDGGTEGEIVPITEGGTGADNAADARTNLGFADSIVEQGTSGIWTYRKWNSGIAECWGSKNASVPSGWSPGSGIILTLPFTFKTVVYGIVQFHNYQIARAYTVITPANATIINIQTNSESELTAFLSIDVRGTWK